jgi:hypothetical protein
MNELWNINVIEKLRTVTEDWRNYLINQTDVNWRLRVGKLEALCSNFREIQSKVNL